MGCTQPKIAIDPLFNEIRYNLVRFQFEETGIGSGTIIDWNNEGQVLILTCLHNLKKGANKFHVNGQNYYENVRIYFEQQPYPSPQKFQILTEGTLDFSIIKIKHRKTKNINKIPLYSVGDQALQVNIYSWKKHQLDQLKHPKPIGKALATLHSNSVDYWQYDINTIGGHSGSALFTKIDGKTQIVGIHTLKQQNKRYGIATKGLAWRSFSQALQRFNTPDNTQKILKSITQLTLDFNKYSKPISIHQIDKAFSQIRVEAVKQIKIGDINFNKIVEKMQKHKLFQAIQRLQFGMVLKEPEMVTLLNKTIKMKELTCTVSDLQIFNQINKRYEKMEKLKIRKQDSGRIVSAFHTASEETQTKHLLVLFKIFQIFPNLVKIDIGCDIRNMGIHTPGCLAKKTDIEIKKHQLNKLKIEQSDLQLRLGRRDSAKEKQIEKLNQETAQVIPTSSCRCIE